MNYKTYVTPKIHLLELLNFTLRHNVRINNAKANELPQNTKNTDGSS